MAGPSGRRGSLHRGLRNIGVVSWLRPHLGCLQMQDVVPVAADADQAVTARWLYYAFAHLATRRDPDQLQQAPDASREDEACAMARSVNFQCKFSLAMSRRFPPETAKEQTCFS